MAPAEAFCPYVGLRPFREADYLFFFGRERDVRIVSSNLRSETLTVLYGASGVGKSSVLQAGVMPHLRSLPKAAVVYFNAWQNTAFLDDLTQRCTQALAVAAGGQRLDDVIQHAEARLYLLLDQFEEFLLYHAPGMAGEPFESALARIVNRTDVTARLLIGIREDALSRFDQRFGIRIPNLLANTLALEHLRLAAARRAIEGPLRVLNEREGLGENGYRAEDALVEEVLRQVQTGRVELSESVGAGRAGALRLEGRVETAFLQLVLKRLWNEETQAGSRLLRAATLDAIGGAGKIVARHVDQVMAQFTSPRECDIAAAMFRYLVTPSGTKIAQATEDLITFAEAPEAETRRVLARLTDQPDARILRRLASPERYEIFHDVLAQPILDWRRSYFAAKERAEQERRAEAQAREARRMRRMAAALAVVALGAGAAAWFALDQRREAREHASQEETLRTRAASAAFAAKAAAELAQARLTELQAKEAELKGNRALALRLETEAAESRKQAESLKRTADDLREGAALQLDGKDRGYRDALQELDRLRRDRSDLQTQLDRTAGENALLRRQLEEAEARQRTTAPRQEPPPEQPAPAPAPAARRTVQAGVSAGPLGGTAGTICCFVRDARGQTYALSADHVFPRTGAMIVQPASMDGGGANDVIAEVTRVLEPGSGTNRAAGAIARLLPGVQGASGRFNGIAERVQPGQPLRVFGRTTRAGRGQVTAVDLALSIATGTMPARFAGLIGTNRLSQPGDSGAPVVTPDNRLVGFVYGGSETMTVVMPIRPVLEALGVELVP